MSHNEFEKIMAEISRKITEVYQAEVASYYNVSAESAACLRDVHRLLDTAADAMDRY